MSVSFRISCLADFDTTASLNDSTTYCAAHCRILFDAPYQVRFGIC